MRQRVQVLYDAVFDGESPEWDSVPLAAAVQELGAEVTPLPTPGLC